MTREDAIRAARAAYPVSSADRNKPHFRAICRLRAKHALALLGYPDVEPADHGRLDFRVRWAIAKAEGGGA